MTLFEDTYMYKYIHPLVQGGDPRQLEEFSFVKWCIAARFWQKYLSFNSLIFVHLCSIFSRRKGHNALQCIAITTCKTCDFAINIRNRLLWFISNVDWLKFLIDPCQYFCLICVSRVRRDRLHQAEARLQVITLSSEGGEEGGWDGDQARRLH